MNAAAFSRHDPTVLSSALDQTSQPLLRHWIIDRDHPGPARALPPLMAAELDRTLICPTVPQEKVLAEICTATGMLDQGCGQSDAMTITDLGHASLKEAGHSAFELRTHASDALANASIHGDVTGPD